MTIQCDIIVVGAGPVGLTLTAALAEDGLNVCLIDAQETLGQLPEIGYETRVSAINRASQAVLDSIGAWARLPQERLGHFESMHVWDGVGGASVEFSARALGTDTLGHIVENRALQLALAEVVQDRSNVQWLRGALLTSLNANGDGVTARAGDETVFARVAVGADGARSAVRELSGLASHMSSYDQSAIVANLRMEHGHANTAWQRFMPTGPLAVLPLPGDFASIVWTTTPENAAELLDTDSETFNRAVEEAFESRRGAVLWSAQRASFPLHRVSVAEYAGHRVALTGDAAHAIHPLAGQGLNLGLMDAAALAEVISHTASRGRDFGGQAALARYQRWRKAHNVGVQNSMDVLRWLFGERAAPVRALRNLGLTAVDSSGPIKRQLARLACGLSGDLPSRAQARY
jgi:2-polyprenylphenol 6-hydroxylase